MAPLLCRAAASLCCALGGLCCASALARGRQGGGRLLAAAPGAGRAEAWNVTEVQRRLRYLGSGEYRRAGAADGLFEYRLPPFESHGVPGPQLRHFTTADVRDCLANRWLHFYGDSRLRYLYAAAIKHLLGSELPDRQDDCPHHHACPYHNFYGFHSKLCVQYFEGLPDGACWDRRHSGARISFGWNVWAKPGVANESLLRSSAKPDVLLMSNGIWALWGNYLAEATGSDPARPRVDIPLAWRNDKPPLGPESNADRLTFFEQVQELVSGPETLKVLVGYPTCKETFYTAQDVENLEEPLRTALVQEGWASMEPRNYTLRGVRSPEGIHPAVWSEDMQPLSSLPEKVKWDPCEGPHTTDTLADLEMQMLWNAICPSMT